MRKAVPCKQCGTARLHNEKAEYILGKMPDCLRRPGGVLTWKCFCGKVGKMVKAEWIALPDLDKEIDAKI